MMTEHPLTDEICCQLWQDNKDNWLKFQEPCPATRRTMRAAADWQLEKVITAWEQCLESPRTDIQDLLDFGQKLKAMRPTTTTQENNDD